MNSIGVAFHFLMTINLFIAITATATFKTSPLASTYSLLNSRNKKLSLTQKTNGDDFCSSFCECDMWFKLRRATCTSKHLFSFKTGVSNTVQALDLSDNSISTLLNYDLKETGLVNLKYLNLSHNSVNEIGSFAFVGLEDLAVLDLSNNHLYYIPRDTFLDSSNLRILLLDRNQFGTKIPDLQSKSISELGLSNCQIGHVDTQAFAGLEHLRKLDLSKNYLIQIDSWELKPLQLLKEINLNDNPWACDGFKSLQSYLENRKIRFDPPCGASAGVNLNDGKKFEKMTDGTNSRGGMFQDRQPKWESDGKRAEILYNRQKNSRWVTEPPTDLHRLADGENNGNENHKRFLKNLTEVSPIWIFGLGFCLGGVTGMIGTYIWITGTLSCRCPKLTTRRNRLFLDNSSQRISLIGPTCPGTPPPPYRDVFNTPSLTMRT
ncbi:uncharacterized protein LOC105688326 isoform X1 [Athalia rosae]|uniref:uncharacterized protein LOC105688326 isoform X1 n=1 Tax=Athalia rosae TaxID=37344 RepID=UPI0020336E2A|nr:uncharacterized protein LOC105688326 isoform X1 [Athalia rosae]XP_020709456.2 uncharacterized protein LOC105688326 isoform X1 [Athalia rosae]XP_020709457.2 uncharacterized protein LOC105688326 isoform X1 [Athalia rosae]XP_020709460.2 uncharacterized protein LOC105688326 isoform X1 [Athalia rosae]XP_048506271.1 uncharacterized protein LOC105688326 isoform X1 [Athalia rosae]